MKEHKSLELILASRRAIIGLVDPLSIDEINKIPAKMGNNIIWNMAHLIAVQQERCYNQSGIEGHVPSAFINSYRYGTRPIAPVGSEFCSFVKQEMVRLVQLTEQDYVDGKFQGFQAFSSRIYPGLEIENIEDAFQFILLHEGLHQGYIRQIMKLI